jgi:hypothetical protein
MEKIYQRLYVDELLIPKDSEVISITAVIKTKEGQHKEELDCSLAFYENEEGEEICLEENITEIMLRDTLEDYHAHGECENYEESEMTMSKDYSIGIFECTFYKMDEDGNTLNNPDGTVKLFTADDVDMSYWSDDIDEDDLTEIKEKE